MDKSNKVPLFPDGTTTSSRPSYEVATTIQAQVFANIASKGSSYHVTLDSGRNYKIFQVGKPYVVMFRRSHHIFIDNLIQASNFGGFEILSVVRVVGAVPRFWAQTTRSNTEGSSSKLPATQFIASGWQRTPCEAMKILVDEVGYAFLALHKGDGAKVFGITSTEYMTKLSFHPELDAPIKLLVRAQANEITNLTHKRLRTPKSPTTKKAVTSTRKSASQIIHKVQDAQPIVCATETSTLAQAQAPLLPRFEYPPWVAHYLSLCAAAEVAPIMSYPHPFPSPIGGSQVPFPLEFQTSYSPIFPPTPLTSITTIKMAKAQPSPTVANAPDEKAGGFEKRQRI